MESLRAFQWRSIIKPKWPSYLHYNLQGLLQPIAICGIVQEKLFLNFHTDTEIKLTDNCLIYYFQHKLGPVLSYISKASSPCIWKPVNEDIKGPSLLWSCQQMHLKWDDKLPTVFTETALFVTQNVSLSVCVSVYPLFQE